MLSRRAGLSATAGLSCSLWHVFYRASLYVLTTRVTVCVCHTELKGYFFNTFVVNTISDQQCLDKLDLPPIVRILSGLHIVVGDYRVVGDHDLSQRRIMSDRALSHCQTGVNYTVSRCTELDRNDPAPLVSDRSLSSIRRHKATRVASSSLRFRRHARNLDQTCRLGIK